MKNIPWKKLNDRYKRDYAKAAEEALSSVRNRNEVLAMAEEGNEKLKDLDMIIKRKLAK